MVDADLQTATGEIAGEFQQLDIISVLTTGAGIGLGLFTAEFFAEIAGNSLGGGSSRRRTSVEIASKFGVAGAHLLARRFLGGPMLGVLLVLGAAGASASAVLQIVETTLSVLQEGEVPAGAPENTGTAEVEADSAEIGSSSQWSV